MGTRSGMRDVLDAIAILSGVVLVIDVVSRTSKAAQSAERHARTKSRLEKIEKGIEALNAKLGAK